MRRGLRPCSRLLGLRHDKDTAGSIPLNQAGRLVGQLSPGDLSHHEESVTGGGQSRQMLMVVQKCGACS